MVALKVNQHCEMCEVEGFFPCPILSLWLALGMWSTLGFWSGCSEAGVCVLYLRMWDIVMFWKIGTHNMLMVLWMMWAVCATLRVSAIVCCFQCSLQKSLCCFWIGTVYKESANCENPCKLHVHSNIKSYSTSSHHKCTICVHNANQIVQIIIVL